MKIVLRKLQSRIRALFGKHTLDAEMDEEMRSHIEMQTQENIANGMPPEEARYAALRQFGHVEGVKETCRDRREGFVGRQLSVVTRDVRFAIRQMLKNPGVTLVNVLTLAIAIGATTAIYSSVKTTILAPLPVADAERLMTIESINVRNSQTSGVNPATIADLRELEYALNHLSISRFTDVKYRGNEFTELIRGNSVSDSFFSLWGVQPLLGRTFSEGESRAGAPPVVVLAHDFWESYLNGDPEIIGKNIVFDGGTFDSPFQSYTVIGVMPEGFTFPLESVNFWLPLADPQVSSASDDPMGRRYFRRTYALYFRLADGVAPEKAQAILDVIATRQAEVETRLGNNRDWSLRLRPVSEIFDDEATRETLWTLFAVIVLVWLIACANVANLLLARAEGRRQEMGMRAALGAGRVRLIRQMLMESTLLALLAGACGLILTNWGLEALDWHLKGIRMRPLALDWGVFGRAMGVSLLTGIVFGLIPAWNASKPNLFETLKQSGTSTTQALGGRWLVRGLILGEIALAVILLVGAGLTIRSVVNVLRVDMGYESEGLISVSVMPPFDKYASDQDAFRAFVDRLADNLLAIQGVESLGLLAQSSMVNVTPEEREERVTVIWNGCGGGKRNPFVTMGVPLIEGRFLDAPDIGNNRIVINEAAAHAFWPGESAVGKRLARLDGVGRRLASLDVVGVVGDMRQTHTSEPYPEINAPLEEIQSFYVSPQFYLRSRLDIGSLIQPIHAAITQAEPGVLNRVIGSVEEDLRGATQGRRFFTALLAMFAAVGLGLAAIGLYGLMAFGVQRRTREIGVRMALGATKREILALVMSDGLRLAAAGLALGIVGAFFATRILQASLFGISPRDPLTLALVVPVLLLAAAAACYLPARRAARIHPMEALRHE